MNQILNELKTLLTSFLNEFNWLLIIINIIIS